MIDIELAGFRAWPASEEINDRGLVLRRSAGYTKRANSANLLQAVDGDFSARVHQCEQYFETHNLPCIFRLPAFSELSPFDQYLESLGYRLVDPSLVMERPLECLPDINNPHKVSIEYFNLSEWLGHFSRLSGSAVDKQTAHIEILERIADPIYPMVLVLDGEPVACGLGVLSDKLLGVFDLVTSRSWRNQGFGGLLVLNLLNWARGRGADKSYLQVVANNHSALSLYERMGYETAYKYWYRMK